MANDRQTAINWLGVGAMVVLLAIVVWLIVGMAGEPRNDSRGEVEIDLPRVDEHAVPPEPAP
jgi:hypothetical protein